MKATGWLKGLEVTAGGAGVVSHAGRANPAYIDAAHRVHARVEDCVRTGKDTGIGKFPSTSFALNQAWLAASLTAATLLAWLRLLALDSELAKAEPKSLRYRILHGAARRAAVARRTAPIPWGRRAWHDRRSRGAFR